MKAKGSLWFKALHVKPFASPSSRDLTGELATQLFLTRSLRRYSLYP